MTGVWASSGKTGGGILASSIAFRAATNVRMVAMVTDKERHKVNRGRVLARSRRTGDDCKP